MQKIFITKPHLNILYIWMLVKKCNENTFVNICLSLHLSAGCPVSLDDKEIYEKCTKYVDVH